MLDIPRIGRPKSLIEINARTPPIRRQPRGIQKPPRCTIGLRVVPLDGAPESNNLADTRRQLANRQIFSRSNVDDLIPIVALHQQETRIGKVVNVQKLPAWLSRSPERNARGVRPPGFVESPNKSGNDVTLFRIEIVSGTIEVGRHDRDEIRPVLPVVRAAHFDARDFRDGVRLICRLEIPRQQFRFCDRHLREFGVHAHTAEKEQFAHAISPCRLDHIALNGKIRADEIAAIRLIRHDAADSGGGEVHLLGALPFEKREDIVLVFEIEIPAIARDDVGVTAGTERPDKCAPHKTCVAGDIYARAHGEKTSRMRHARIRTPEGTVA